ncbi:MAG: hypothetical protein ACI4GY_04975 [Acutalibacteraceae bacterium]
MDQFIEAFTKIYQTICKVILNAFETIKGLVDSISDSIEEKEAE